MNSYIIKTDGTQVPYAPANGKAFTLKEMQTAVGGYIERVGTYQNKGAFGRTKKVCCGDFLLTREPVTYAIVRLLVTYLCAPKIM